VTPIVDSHVYCFPSPPPERMGEQQVWHALHHQPAWRTRDRARSDPLRLLDPAPGEPHRLADADFRIDREHRRFVWTVDGEDVTKQIYPPNLADIAFPPASCIAEMDYAGVDWGLIHVDRVFGTDNEYHAACVRQYPDRLRSMAIVDERGIPDDPDRVAADLEHAIRDLGLHAIKFIPEYAYRSGTTDWVDGPFGMFWDRATALGVPVFFTLGSAPGSADEQEGYRAELGNIRRFQARHPDAVVSLTHGFPWRAFLDGNGLTLPDWLWEPFEHPNLHIEVSFPVRLGDVFEYPWTEVWPALEAMLRHVGPDRMLWGCDMPFQNRFCTYRQSLVWLDRTGLLDPGAAAAIKGGTAARLLGIDVGAPVA
jgi:predicted TIM-barrel fold metal-dependent hydrolase